MERSQIEEVLANWIAQATAVEGRLPDGLDPAKWIAANFVNWWHSRVDELLSDAIGEAESVRAELNRLGGLSNKDLGEALHTLAHVTDALWELRDTLGLNDGASD